MWRIEKKVEIVALQLTDLARTWWKAEARRIEVTADSLGYFH